MVSQRKSATQYIFSLQKQNICNEKLYDVADMHGSAFLQRSNWCVAEFAMQILPFFVVSVCETVPLRSSSPLCSIEFSAQAEFSWEDRVPRCGTKLESGVTL